MTKGKFGLSPAAIAVIAFGLCALMQPQSVLLVAGFALLTERDEWLNRQAMQALLLTIGYYLAELVTGLIFGGLVSFFGWVRLYGAAGAMSTVNTFVGDVLYLALIAFSVLAILRVLRGEDAGLPFIARMASGDFAAAFQKSQEPKPSPVQSQHQHMRRIKRLRLHSRLFLPQLCPIFRLPCGRKQPLLVIAPAAAQPCGEIPSFAPSAARKTNNSLLRMEETICFVKIVATNSLTEPNSATFAEQ